ncbi:MAG: efflux RND transporter permease subunit [Rhodospirillaceae bacterium]|nr:efflux RND transporter permease subunit [Rhodospirillaceae bacterium]
MGFNGIVRFFVRHHNASNLLMIMAIIFGLLAVLRLNTQFFPTIGFDSITISVSWPGASAEDVDEGIVEVIEPEVRFLDGVQEVSSRASEGGGSVTLEFEDGTDMQAALSEVEQAVGRITTLPEDAEEPTISRTARYETVTRLAVTGAASEAELRDAAETVRDELLSRGIDRVVLFGARDQEIRVEVDDATLRRLDMTLQEIAASISATSRDTPLGQLDGALELQLRSLGLLQTAEDFRGIEIRSYESGAKIYLGDIAQVTDDFERGEALGLIDGEPAIEITIQRAETADTLEAAAIVDAYLQERAGDWPQGVEVTEFDPVADLLVDRIMLLVENGASGLVLVLLVLFAFLNARVAFWIAAGIPISMLATAVVMLMMGQTINMISLFGAIMALGIIVDDAIVVGEHAAFRREQGLPPQRAAEMGALRMLAPVSAATLTTIAAFLPILLISGVMGQMVSAIPQVVIAILLASLVECFVILPAHLRDSLAVDLTRQSRFRLWFDRGFARFRDGPFRRLVTACVRARYLTVAGTIAVLLLSAGMVAGGRVGFQFFSSPESETVFADFSFAPGTPIETTRDMLAELQRALHAAEDELTDGEGGLVEIAFGRIGAGTGNSSSGDHAGSLHVQLPPSDSRTVRNAEILAAWRAHTQSMPGLERMEIRARMGGPPGRDIDIRLTGDSADALKAASLEVQDLLRTYTGVSAITDSLPYGRPELILELTPRGRALGLTTEDLASQVRSAFEGTIADRFARDAEEVTVRVVLEDDDRTLGDLRDLPLSLPGGGTATLSDVATVREDVGFSSIQREDGVRQVAITAEVNSELANNMEILANLPTDGLDRIAEANGVSYRFAGRAEEQQDTFSDLGLGAAIGLASIYLVLAWVFASYGRPIIVMSIIPFGLIGAVWGHYLLGYTLSVMSLIALLGLSGILVNDSIIMVSTISEHLKSGTKSVREAIVDGTCERLRAVILTSLTTIGGLLPLLFETSLQAQFLIPMAITLVFGLAITTLLVLLVVPALMLVQIDVSNILSAGWGRRHGRRPGWTAEPAAGPERG